jgi:hypothetical protein
MKLSQLPVGALVKDPNTKYNNDVIIWQVLEHGHTGDPSGSTTLQSRDILTLKCFDAKEPSNSDSNRKQYGNNRYKYSNILQWLNSDKNSWYEAQHTADQEPSSSYVNSGLNPYSSEAGFLTNLSDKFKKALMTVSKTTVLPSIDGDGSETVENKVFLTSTTEVGLANENNIAEGSIYSLYNTASNRIKNLFNDAAKGGYTSATSPGYWWLRTPNASFSRNVRYVYTDGTLSNHYAYNGNIGVAPAFCISSDTEVSDTPDASNVYTLQFAPSCVKAYIGDENGEAKLIWGTAMPKIVSWADGTDEEIVALVEAADAGEIDLYEDAGWRVGDERTISLSPMSATGVGESHVAQDVTLVLMSADTGVEDSTNPCWNYQYVTAKTGRSYPSFIVGQKNVLANGTSGEFGYMNSSNTNSGSWNGCARRTWCNNVYYNAIPSTIKSIFKQVDVKTIQTYNGSSMQTSQDYFFLPVEREIFDSRSYSNSTEWNNLSQFDYYKTSANRIKYQGNAGAAYIWWGRSPRYDNSSRFCYVNSGGNANGGNASLAYGLAPCGCI